VQVALLIGLIALFASLRDSPGPESQGDNPRLRPVYRTSVVHLTLRDYLGDAFQRFLAVHTAHLLPSCAAAMVCDLWSYADSKTYNEPRLESIIKLWLLQPTEKCGQRAVTS